MERDYTAFIERIKTLVSSSQPAFSTQYLIKMLGLRHNDIRIMKIQKIFKDE